MRKTPIVLGALLVVIFAGCAFTHAGSTIDQYPAMRQEAYLLQAPDEIQVSVLPQAELNTKLAIRPDGKISLPLIGDVFVQGMTPMEASQKIAEEFSKYVKNPSVSVIVTGFNSKKVYVIGEVFRQGAYPYTGDKTVFGAVQEAGSFTRRASLGRVLLVRGELKNP